MTFCPTLPPLSQVIQKWTLLSNKSHAKRLGQNFLLNPSLLQSIVDKAGDLTSCSVIEIGPGPGGLTREILKKHPQTFIAIEKDFNCVAAINDLFAWFQTNDPFYKGINRLKLIQEDALSIDIEKLKNGLPTKVISNLPYNVGTQILLNFLMHIQGIDQFVFMFQKEVANRILAKPRTKDYSRLSILSQYLTQGEKVMTLPPASFTPPPKVHSCVVRLTPRPDADLSLIPTLSKITQACFQTRRKKILCGLKSLYSSEQILFLLNKLPYLKDTRPEELSVTQFVDLAKFHRNQII